MIILSEIISKINAEDPEINDKCALILEGITSGPYTIVDLVTELKLFLLSPIPDDRTLGVRILATVLENLPVDFLNLQQVTVIATFLAEKLRDHHQVIPYVLKCLLAISEYENFPKEVLPSILNNLFQHVSCQQQQQADRFNIYTIFQNLLNKYSAELQPMGVDLVYGVINSIDGERDPRNLLFLFKWMKTFLQVIPLGHLVEEVFDVLACYFPVDFKAPPSSRDISREDLAEALCPCLCAIPEFGNLCIPLALEKLDSSLVLAKTDSLQLLAEGCRNFNISTYTDNTYDIWSKLQKEIFTSSNNSIRRQSLHTLTKIVTKISPGDEFKAFLKTTVDSLKGNLIPDNKHFQISSEILYHIALGSSKSSKFILKEIGSIFLNTYNITTTPATKVIILRCLVPLSKAFYQNCTDKNEDVESVINVCLKAIYDTDRYLRAEGFNSITELAEYVSIDTSHALYNELLSALGRMEASNVRQALIKCFKKFASVHEEETLKLVGVISNECLSNSLMLEAVCELADLPTFHETVVEVLLKCITTNSKCTTDSVDHLKKLLRNEKPDDRILRTFLQKDIIKELLQFSLEHLAHLPIELLVNISAVLRCVIGTLSVSDQENLVSKYLDPIFGYTQQTENCAFILSGLLARIRQKITLPNEVLNWMVKVANNSDNEIVRHESGQLIANILNKKPSDENFFNYVEDLKSACMNSLQDNEFKPLLTIAWMAKALVMRDMQEGYSLIDLLFDMIQNPVVGEAFNIIMRNDFDMLNDESFCNETSLYQQKVFIYVIHKLSENFHAHLDTHLRVFGCLLEVTPENVVMNEVNQISKFILLSLDKCEDENILFVILNTVQKLLLERSELIEEHLDDYVSRILKLTTFDKTMKIRILSLQWIIQLCSSFSLHKLLPLKDDILNQLTVCVDDKKRLVRKEAMEARSVWFLLDALL